MCPPAGFEDRARSGMSTGEKPETVQPLAARWLQGLCRVANHREERMASEEGCKAPQAARPRFRPPPPPRAGYGGALARAGKEGRFKQPAPHLAHYPHDTRLGRGFALSGKRRRFARAVSKGVSVGRRRRLRGGGASQTIGRPCSVQSCHRPVHWGPLARGSLRRVGR